MSKYIAKKLLYKITCVFLCTIFTSLTLQSHAFALRPMASKSSPNIVRNFNKQVDPSSAYVAEEAEWARVIAKKLYKGKIYNTKVTYYDHACGVADTLIQLNPKIDELTIAAALLHKVNLIDIRRELKKEAKHIQKEEQEKIVKLVKGMNETSRLPYLPPNKKGGRTIQNQMNMIIQMAENPERMYLDIAKKFQTLITVSDSQLVYLFREITDIYVPLIERLGMDDWARRFGNEALKVYSQIFYSKIKADIEQRLGMSYQDAIVYIKKKEESVKKELRKHNIKADVYVRLKGIYSVYEKMESEEKESIEDVDDLFGITMVFNNEDDLWLASRIPFRYGDGIEEQTEIKVDKNSEEFGVAAFHVGIRDKDNRPYEFQLMTKGNYHKLKYGEKAHWAYKMARKTGQKFDVDEIQRTGDFYRDFKALKKSLDKWVFVFRQEDYTGKTTLKPLRLLNGSIPADFAASKSVDLFNKDYRGVKAYMVSYDSTKIPDKSFRESKEKKLAQKYTLKTGEVIDIRVQNNFLNENSNARQVIRRSAKMLRTYLLLDNLDSEQMLKSAKRGRDILKKRDFVFKNKLLSKRNKIKVLKKSKKIQKDEGFENSFLYEVAISLGLKDTKELCAALCIKNKRVVEQTEQYIGSYALRREKDALIRGRQLLETGNNTLNLNDSTVLEGLRLMLNDPSIRVVSFNRSIKIMSLQEFFIAIGNNKIEAELVKKRLSATKLFKISRPDLCSSAA